MTDLDPHRPLLIVGDRGMLAAAVVRAARSRGYRVVGVDREACDVTDADAVRRTFDRVRPGVVFNCCAYTAVDKAEQEEQAATAVNGHAVAHLASACAGHGATLVHVSTDFVFDGHADRPYREDDPVAPLSAYGRSKRVGEEALLGGDADFVLVRTSWLYGPWVGRPFPQVMLDVARAGKPLTVVDDQRGTPTYTVDLAESTFDLLAAGGRGLFHLTADGETTWFDFAKATLDAFGVTPVSLEPTTAAAWAQLRPEAATRPAYSVLDCSKAEAVLGRPLRPWHKALLAYRDASAA